MGQKQAAYNTAGQILAFYDTTDSPAPAGTTVLDITLAQWQACLATPGYTVVNGALVAPPSPTASQLAQQQLQASAMALLAGTVSLSSSSTPSLNGSYTVSPADQAHIAAEVQSLMLNGTFADGSSTVAWPDATGATHDFSVTEFKAFATAVGSFVADCFKVLNATSTTLPSAALTIS